MTDSSSEKPRVLVVDDEEVIRTLLVSFFKKDGRFDIDTAEDGRKGLEAAGKHSYAVVISDLKMPNMPGLPFIRALRRSHPHIPVIVFTGYGEFEDAIEALRLGAVNFLRKPSDLQNVIGAVEKALEMTRPLQDRRQVFSWARSISTDLSIPPLLSKKHSCLQFLIEPLVPMELATPGELKNVLLSLDEILNNAVVYGALGIDSAIRDEPQGHTRFQEEIRRRENLPENRKKNIRIQATYDRHQAVFTITDPGSGFDYTSLPDPTDPENLMSEHGRGLLLVQCFMDEVRFNDQGNSVTILKKKKDPETED